MSVYYPQITASFGGNTAGTTLTQFTGNLVFAGGPNITLSNSTDSLGQTISFSGGAGVGGGFTGGVSTGGNTSGTTGTVGSQIIFVGGNNITLSQSTNGASATITFSGGAGGAAFSAGISTGGNTSGTSGTNSSGLVLVGGNNITLSQATGAGGNTITISNGIPIVAGTNTQTVQSVFFSNSNGMVIGITDSTITIRDKNVTGFSNYQAVGLAANAIATSRLSLQRIYFPRNFDATRLEFIGHMTGSSAAGSGALSVNVALYTLDVSTLQRVSTASAAITWTSGSAVTAASLWGGQSGTRYRSIALGTWNITPGDYVFGMAVDTASSQTAHSWSFYGMSSLSIQAVPGSGNYVDFVGNGLHQINTSAPPSSINMTVIDQTGASVNRQPFFRLLGTF